MRRASGIEPSAIARPVSAAMRIGRRASRSTQTPAGSAKRRNGSSSNIQRVATLKVDALRPMTAMSGSASWETCEPNWLIVCAPQRRR